MERKATSAKQASADKELYKQAKTLFQESLALFREIGDRQGVAWCLTELAGMSGTSGQPERAVLLFGAAEALFESIGAHLDVVDRAEYDRNLAEVRSKLSEKVFADAWARGHAMTVDDALELASGGAPT